MWESSERSQARLRGFGFEGGIFRGEEEAGESWVGGGVRRSAGAAEGV